MTLRCDLVLQYRKCVVFGGLGLRLELRVKVEARLREAGNTFGGTRLAPTEPSHVTPFNNTISSSSSRPKKKRKMTTFEARSLEYFIFINYHCKAESMLVRCGRPSLFRLYKLFPVPTTHTRQMANTALLRNLIKLATIIVQGIQTPIPHGICQFELQASKPSLRAVLSVALLAHREGDIAILDHVLDLFSH